MNDDDRKVSSFIVPRLKRVFSIVSVDIRVVAFQHAYFTVY